MALLRRGIPCHGHTGGPSPQCFSPFAFCLPGSRQGQCQGVRYVRCRGTKKGQARSAGFLPAQPRLLLQKAGRICNRCVRLADPGWCGSAGAGGVLGVRLPYILVSAARRHGSWLLPCAPTCCSAIATCLCRVFRDLPPSRKQLPCIGLSQVHCFGYSHLAAGEVGAVQLPSPLPKIAVAFCSKQLPLAGWWPAACCTRAGERGAI